MTKLRTSSVLLALACISSSLACSKDEGTMPAASTGSETPPSSTPGTDRSTSLSPSAPVSNDAQITEVLATVDSGEIQQAQIAKQHAKNERVQKFAEQMIEHHTASKEQGSKLAASKDMKAEESTLSRSLQAKGLKVVQELQQADEASFDRAYMKAQANQHQEVLDTIKNQLLPIAQSAEVKAQLEKTQHMVEMHLSDARSIMQTL